MAKRKKQSGKRRSTGRRMSGTGSNEMTTFLGAVLGYVVGKMLSSKLLPNVSDKIKGAGMVAVGHFLVPKLGKSPMIAGAGMGLKIAGADTALRGFGVISGTGYVRTPALLLPNMNGMGIPQSVVAGQGIPQSVVGSRRRRYRTDG